MDTCNLNIGFADFCQPQLVRALRKRSKSSVSISIIIVHDLSVSESLSSSYDNSASVVFFSV